jgi:hypothetical protein
VTCLACSANLPMSSQTWACFPVSMNSAVQMWGEPNRTWSDNQSLQGMIPCNAVHILPIVYQWFVPDPLYMFCMMYYTYLEWYQAKILSTLNLPNDMLVAKQFMTEHSFRHWFAVYSSQALEV